MYTYVHTMQFFISKESKEATINVERLRHEKKRTKGIQGKARIKGKTTQEIKRRSERPGSKHDLFWVSGHALFRLVHWAARRRRHRYPPVAPRPEAGTPATPLNTDHI